MTDELFFVPILASAMRRPDDWAGWRDAFAQISARCNDPRASGARENWHRFLDAVLTDTEPDEDDAIADAAMRMLLERLSRPTSDPLPDPAALWIERIHREMYATLVHRIQETLSRASTLSLQFNQGRDLLGAWPWPLAGDAMVRGLRPGTYEITLDTGRRLWTGRLEPEDLLWYRAFPQQPLAVAAESGPPTVYFSRRIPLKVAPLTIVVYPGVETGAARLVAEPSPV